MACNTHLGGDTSQPATDVMAQINMESDGLRYVVGVTGVQGMSLKDTREGAAEGQSEMFLMEGDGKQ